MTKLHMAFDLELEQPKTNPQTPDSHFDEAKIIQIGYCIYTFEPDLDFLEKNCLNVALGKPLSEFIKKLTRITDEELAAGISLEQAYQIMCDARAKHNASRIINQWGGGDLAALLTELPKTVKNPWGTSGARNIKHLFQVYAEANGLNVSGGLKKSLSKCGMGFWGKGHNAMVDSINTARMHHFLHNSFKKTM